MSDTKDNEYPIFESVERCYQLFENLLNVLQTRVSDQLSSRGNVYRSREIVLDYKWRLRLWAGSVHAIADPLVNLDTRLRNRQNLQEMILSLLQLIGINLRRSMDPMYECANNA